jgi:hypothetical protein
MKTRENLIILIDGYLKIIENNIYANTDYFTSYGAILSKLSYALTHLGIHRIAIQENKNYVPKHEIEMILFTIKSLPPLTKFPSDSRAYKMMLESITEKEEKIIQFLLSLKHHLRDMGDLLIERSTGIEKQLFKNRIEFGVQQIDKYLLEQLQQTDKITEVDESKPPIVFLESEFKSFPRTIKRVKQFFSAEWSEHKLKASLSEPDSFLAEIFKVIFSTNKHSHLLKMIQWLQNQFTDKKEFAQLCFNTFQYTYNISKKNGLDTTYASPFFLELLSILDQPLKPGELSAIVQNYDSTHGVTSLQLINYDVWDMLAMRHEQFGIDLGNMHEVVEKMHSNISKTLPIYTFPSLANSVKVVAKQVTFSSEVKSFELMDLTLTGCSIDVIQAFNKLVTKFVYVNKSAPEHQQRNCLLFFNKHRLAIRQLINLMGVKAIQYMANMMAVSVLPLERMLLSFPNIHSTLIEQLAAYFKEHSPSLPLATQCLVALNSLIKLKVHSKITGSTLVAFYMQIVETSPTVPVFLENLAKLLLKNIFKESDFKISTDQIGKMFERISVSQFVQLGATTQTMDSDKYREIFLNILKLDLLGGDIDQLLHDSKQENLLGKTLALHNQAIREKLEESKLSPEMVMRYKKSYDFIVYPSENTDLSFQRAYLVLWTYLIQFQEVIASNLTQNLQLSLSDKNAVTKISSEIDALQAEIDKKAESKMNENTTKIIKTLSRQLNGRVKCIEKACQFHSRTSKAMRHFSDGFYEFARHVLNQLALIKQNNIENPIKELKSVGQPECFTVQLWDKRDPHTFFLGNDVGCCLAAGNDRFSAMVQRRMDDAMLFPVVIDRKTNQVVALIWAYLATDENNQIILLANFFEVNAKYGTLEPARKAVLNGLLQFINQYLQDTGIQYFYMNHLKYGHNVGDLDDYPMEPLVLKDKLGGPFIPDLEACEIAEEKGKNLTNQYYYLASLESTEFHKFSPDILTSKMSASSKSVKQLIESELLTSSSAEKKSDVRTTQTIEEIIEMHPLELKLFFTQPLSRNPLYRELTHTEKEPEEKPTRPSVPTVPISLSFVARLFQKTSTIELEPPTKQCKCIIL